MIRRPPRSTRTDTLFPYTTLQRFPVDAMCEGDGYLLNDPFAGGTHLPDLTLIRPVFLDGEVIGIAAASLHHQDVGGITPGSIPPHSTSLFQAGLRKIGRASCRARVCQSV